MTARHDRAEAALDRALAQARTPQVPPDLARRIVANVTRLPQEAPRVAQDEPANPAHAPRRRVAGFAVALALMAGVAGAVLLGRHGDGGKDAQVLASAAPSSSGTGNVMTQNVPYSLAESGTAPSPAGDSRLAVRPAAAPSPGIVEPDTGAGDIPALEQQALPAPAQPDAAPSANRDEAMALAHQESGGEGKSIGPVDDSELAQPVYGPPAPQGLGVAGGTIAPPAAKPSPRPNATRPSGGPGPGPGPVGGGASPHY